MGNDLLINKLVGEEILKTPRIIEAFRNVDRADFILPEDREDAYGDYPLSIGCGATISQPLTVAFMLELLQPQEGNKILDVGSGSGWTTVLLAYLVGKKGKVIGVEIIPELVKLGREHLNKYQFPQAQIKQAKEGEYGFPEEAPFDKILVSAAAEELPRELVQQLKEGGWIVVPVKNSIWQINKKENGEIEKEEFSGFYFVPLVK